MRFLAMMVIVAGAVGLCRADARTTPEPAPCCPAVTLVSPQPGDTVGLIFIASGQYTPSPLPCGSTIESYVFDGCGKKISSGAAKAKGGAWSFQHTVPAGKGYTVEVVMTKTAAFESAAGVEAK